MKIMKYEMVIVGALETNCYLIYDEQSLECVIVDPGADPGKIIKTIFEMSLIPKILVNTHGHIDHIGANCDIKEKFNVPLLIHQADEPMLSSALQSEMAMILGAHDSPPPDGYLQHNDSISFGNELVKVLHTPGHSLGSVSFAGDGFLLSGDTLFNGGVGRTDLPGGSWGELVNSIQEILFIFPDDTLVLPGHGPSTTIGWEKESNPYVR